MGTRQYLAEVDIDAPVEKVWSILKDVELWPTWTPTMASIERESGEGLAPGCAYAVKQPGLAKALFTVDAVVEGEAFAWSSRAMGVETFADHQLEKLSDTQTRVRLVLEMRGVAVPFLWLLVGTKVRKFVDTEAASLKGAAE